ncbi:linearmycin resistance ATP-binding protein LnrL [Paraliobacillus ryukyuensis]|uniref:ABC-2 type transport system ATP-binding protein n=1 Tax=Paraliobacillus ryukyuensis TaxID=200904 RepID=A0A366DUI1_9BACI|nr:ABC transporter ATP-binding protein [Paraliobacillus ryukyuensis]RBO93149.1 ABC-2 type transport system ATP-binding protein [Paraliobacillus ryukyuensis]
MLAIETKQLSKSFWKNNVVKQIDLQVEKGEILGFLGRNGAGKSTFINMLTGILPPSSGSYALLGVQGPNNAVKKEIGVMPDYSSLYGSMTALKHLRYLSEVSGKKVSQSRAMDVLQLVGLEAHANKKAGKFSFGMKKKLAIAQAIVHDPQLIFLDEPTSGLDAESVIQIHRLIQRLHQQGKTIFMTSHNLDEVEKICSRIAIMKDGKIRRVGTMDELRAYYQSTITVTMKHAPIAATDLATLEPWLKQVGAQLEMEASHFTIQVESEQKIAEIIRALGSYKIDIYRVDVDEPSLEEIFLEE